MTAPGVENAAFWAHIGHLLSCALNIIGLCTDSGCTRRYTVGPSQYNGCRQGYAEVSRKSADASDEQSCIQERSL